MFHAFIGFYWVFTGFYWVSGEVPGTGGRRLRRWSRRARNGRNRRRAGAALDFAVSESEILNNQNNIVFFSQTKQCNEHPRFDVNREAANRPVQVLPFFFDVFKNAVSLFSAEIVNKT